MSRLNVTGPAAALFASSGVGEHAETPATIAMTATARLRP